MIQFLLVFNDWGLLILRAVLGVILVIHGLPKLKDPKTTGKAFEKMGFKPGKAWASVAGFVEAVGGLALIVGFFTQVFALLVAIQFLVIILKLKLGSGLKEMELDLMILAAAILLAVSSAGNISLDSFLGLFLY